MEYGFERVSLDALMSLQEVAASGGADTAALIAKFVRNGKEPSG
jgi:hypothetical protein